jgi:hypothetical protein
VKLHADTELIGRRRSSTDRPMVPRTRLTRFAHPQAGGLPDEERERCQRFARAMLERDDEQAERDRDKDEKNGNPRSAARPRRRKHGDIPGGRLEISGVEDAMLIPPAPHKVIPEHHPPVSRTRQLEAVGSSIAAKHVLGRTMAAPHRRIMRPTGRTRGTSCRNLSCEPRTRAKTVGSPKSVPGSTEREHRYRRRHQQDDRGGQH